MSKRQKFTRRQLLEHLKILDSLPTPLPPTLPPSPPASPTSSLGKRKQDMIDDSDRVKRPRNDPPPPPPPQPSEPVEDGEVSEDPPSIPSLPPPSALPVRRPKHGVVAVSEYDSLHNKYHQQGRELKYSGDARFWSTYPRTSKEYRPLADPPSPDSPYHKNGIQVAKLELLDALVRFTFAIWNKDFSRGTCNFDLWDSSEGYIDWCKSKWEVNDSTSEAEKALCGLVAMIHAFILTRKAVYYNRRYLLPQSNDMFETTRRNIATAIEAAESSSRLSTKSHTPPMLPSPANSIGAANSANSTPTGSDATPSASSNPPASSTSESSDAHTAAKTGPAVHRSLLPEKYAQTQHLPIPSHVTAAANTVSQPINPQLIYSLKGHTKGINGARDMIGFAESVLNLPIMARHFPRTFARMIYTSLSPNEEYEPDFEDEEGELFWPTQCSSGEGLGWVCLMGQAMIREYGKPYGYIGHAGIIKKPTAERPRPSRPHPSIAGR